MAPESSLPEETFLSGPVADGLCPFTNIYGLDRDDFRDAAYEIFFTACRSEPGFGGRNALPYYKSADDGNAGSLSDSVSPAANTRRAAISRVKKELGLKMVNRPRSSSIGSNPLSPTGSLEACPRVGFNTMPSLSRRVRRPLTAAEIMKQQMRITDQSDSRLRKTLMRTLVGQMGRSAETIILPLELLRHLKPSEFNDVHEYHIWQKRQLRILEAGLILHPAIALEKPNVLATRIRDIVDSSEMKPIDTGRNSETMTTLCNSVLGLALRSSPGSGSANVCHWADGYPLNVHIYNALLLSLFDLTEETLVVDEIDELLELMKKTWSVLRISGPMHNLCFTWVLFEQYISTGQKEPDLLSASSILLKEVVSDTKKADGGPIYKKMLGCVLTAITKWCGKRLLDYHENFNKDTVGLMEYMLPLLFSSMQILEDHVNSNGISPGAKPEDDDPFDGKKVDHYIRSSLTNAFAKMVEDQNNNGTGNTEAQDVSKKLMRLARKTEELATKEKDTFSPFLKKWNPIATGVASVTLHTCYGTLLNKYLNRKSGLLNETILVLQRAAKLEKALVKMVVQDSVESEDGGKSIVTQMIPYEVDTVIIKLLKQWIQERLQKGKDLLDGVKQNESWNPKSRAQPYVQSATELISIAKKTLEKFFEIPINVAEDLFHDLIDGLDNIFSDYISFVASCGTKQSYLPTLPPLTRSSHDSKIIKLLQKTSCGVVIKDARGYFFSDTSNPCLTTSRGTQRLYIRLNTLSYLDSQIHSLEKALSVSSRAAPPKSRHGNQSQPTYSYFEQSYSTLQVASQYVAEVAAYRLIFLDSYSAFYGRLYIGSAAKARIRPAVIIMEHNLTFLCTIVMVQNQPLLLKEVMKACLEAFLRVLLAGGSSRVFSVLDHPMIEEDLDCLKQVFYMCGEGLLSRDVLEREAEAANGVVELMGHSTEQLIENFKSVSNEAGGMGLVGIKSRIPMPPTTGKWNKSDPNTILRVLCSRDDRVANRFLKKTFHLPKRKHGDKMD